MKEEKDNLQPETIDSVIEGDKLSPQDYQTSRLIKDIYASSQGYARANEHSLDSIWGRLTQSSEHSIFLQAQWKEPEEEQINIKERKVIQENNASWKTNPLPPLAQPKNRHSLLRVVGISLVAAVAVITILSFTIFSNVLRPVPSTAGNGSSTITGAPQQQTLSSATLVCSFASGDKVTINQTLWGPTLAWSAQGQIAAATYSNVKGFSAKNCAAAFSQSMQQNYEAGWSPDGKKLATVTAGSETIYVLDSHGNVIAQLPFTQLGTLSVSNIVWSSDSNKLIFASQDSKDQESVKSVDVSGSSKVATLVTLPTNSASVIFSPNGKYLLLEHLNKQAKRKDLEILDTNSGQVLNTVLPTPQSLDGWAFSPDGSLLALGGKIYTTVDGNLQGTFDSSGHNVGVLTWSPDGKYLAEGTTAISIYDVHAQKTVVTFGKVDANHIITMLVWAPDSKGLASSITQVQDNAPSQNMVNVWKLN